MYSNQCFNAVVHFVKELQVNTEYLKCVGLLCNFEGSASNRFNYPTILMFTFKDTGKLIVSENTRSLDWKIYLGRFLTKKCKFTFISPPFRYQHASLKISLQADVEKDLVTLQVGQANDVTCTINLVHKTGLKDYNGGFHTFLGFGHGVLLWSIQDININDINHNTTFFVEFQQNGISIDRETSPLNQVPNHPSGSCSCSDYGQAKTKGQDILTKKLKELYVNALHCDFTINVQERKFCVHKAILAVHSDVFAKMMEHDMAEKKTNEVNIEDCDPHAFHEFLLYLYSGKVDTFSNGNVTALHKIADKYGVEHLKEECITYMKNNLSADTFCRFIELALNHGENELLKLSKIFFRNNAKNIILSLNWETFLMENPALAKELSLLLCPDSVQTAED